MIRHSRWLETGHNGQGRTRVREEMRLQNKDDAELVGRDVEGKGDEDGEGDRCFGGRRAGRGMGDAKRRVEDGEEEEFEGEEWEEGKNREGAHPKETRECSGAAGAGCCCWCCALGLAHWHSLPVLSGSLLPLHPAGHWPLDQPEPKGRVPAHGPISDAAPLASQARQELEEEDGDLRGERVNDRRGTGEGGGRCFFFNRHCTHSNPTWPRPAFL